MAGFHKAGPNEALIVSGGGKQPAIIVGGRKFVLPILQKAQTLSLEIMTLTVNTATARGSNCAAGLDIDSLLADAQILPRLNPGAGQDSTD